MNFDFLVAVSRFIFIVLIVLIVALVVVSVAFLVT